MLGALARTTTVPLPPRLRKLVLAAHVVCSVGWLGAVVVYLMLAITGLTSGDAELARGVYPTLELIGWRVLVPSSLAALATGLVQSLGTEWGLLRHSWIVAKLVLTVGGTTVLLMHMPTVSHMAEVAAAATSPSFVSETGRLPIQLVIHAAGGLAILLAATVLSIYKPWGKTRRGHLPR
jgi:hypothetical protein